MCAQDILHQDVFRPAKTPSLDLPFGVRSAGHYKIQHPRTSPDKKIDFIQLFWGVRGAGIIEIDGRPRTLNKNQAALLYPSMRHYLYSDRRYWEYYWLTIDGTLAVSIPAAFGLEAGIYDAGPAPITLFQNLLQLVGQPSKQAEMQACAIAFMILTRAAGSHANQTDELVNAALKQMHQQDAASPLNIKTLAAALGIRRTAFYSRFHAIMGMPPGDYLHRLRIQKAFSLLQHTHLTIADIAAQCGYKDANYFSRVIRRAVGRSPRQFRGPGPGGK